MHPNAYSLVSVTTRPEKMGVSVTFSGTQKQTTKHYSFFPSFYLPYTSTTPFEQLLSTPHSEKYQLLTHANSLQVMCGTWEDLKAIAQRIHAQTNYFPLLIEPERQFLLTQNWRYFQSFDTALNPLKETFANTHAEGLVEELYTTFAGLKTHNPSMEKILMQRIALSHELFVPFADVPLTTSEQLEEMLTNYLFTKHVPLPIRAHAPVDMGNATIGKRENAKKLATQTPLFSEGTCACCKPETWNHSSIHPGSLVSARIAQDGVYIHTHDEKRAQQYHDSHEGKEKRNARAREFGLTIHPMGPLYRGEIISLPLADARIAHAERMIHIEPNMESLAWKCQKTPYLLEQFSTYLDQRIHEHALIHETLVQPYLTKYQLAYTVHAQSNPQVQLHALTQKTLYELKKDLGNHLLRGNTRWRGSEYASLLEAGISE